MNDNEGLKVFELWESDNPRIDHLITLYREDRYKARVIYMNDKYGGYEKYRITVFEKKNGDFNIVYIRKTFGISKTNVMFNREKRLLNISYKKGKFYLISGSQVMPMTIYAIGSKHPSILETIKPYLISKFSWLRFMFEHNVLHGVALNTVVSKKLYSLKKALRHQYKVPYPVAKILHKYKDRHHFVINIKYNLDYLDNIESFKENWLCDDAGVFIDTLFMAKTLNKKLNCSWSSRRLKEVHDSWSKEITEIVYVDGDREMSISDIFKKFADFSSYKLLKTTKEMAYEGMKNSHCVATYVNSVESGVCGIYSISGHTLELGKQWTNSDLLAVKQFKGYSNVEAPKELIDKVTKVVNQFNDTVVKLDPIPTNSSNKLLNEHEDLPF